jgi:predicted enzyme related to lactoylglutathione lyase
MEMRIGFPAGVPAWIDTNQPDLDAAADFYRGLFGWQFDERSSGAGRYMVATLDGDEVAGIGSLLANEKSGAAWNTYVDVDDVDAAAARVRAAGGSVVGGPTDGELARVAACVDPEGATFRLLQPGALKGAATVNAPGSWNFSELNVRDLQGARRFYAAVFGWQTDATDFSEGSEAAVNGADADSLMVRLPGYADFLEQFDPGLRQRHADFGAPPGFSECVAWMLPLKDESASAHWSVTFAVADADDIVESCRRLGGSVVAEPFDVPPTRLAVVRDPAGSQFTVSAFNPG